MSDPKITSEVTEEEGKKGRQRERDNFASEQTLKGTGHPDRRMYCPPRAPL